jgi:glycosyltransferase involved in cell wall biosynthesis
MIRVLHFTPHREVCGIAKYHQRCLNSLGLVPDIQNTLSRYSPYQVREMKRREFGLALRELRRELECHDVLHVQHEFDLFSGGQFAQIANLAIESGRRLVVTAHTAPGERFRESLTGGFGPRAVLERLRQLRERRVFVRESARTFQMASVVICHSAFIASELRRIGVMGERVLQLEHPVPEVSRFARSSRLRDRLDGSGGAMIIAMLGFVHRYKGIQDAIRSLSLLPESYKLAIIGGVHPLSSDVQFLDEIAALVAECNAEKRVFVTGVVTDDDEMSAMIRECDICVFPYDQEYYRNASSDSLSLAFANHMPVVAYPTESIRGVAAATNAVVLCSAASHIDLAREIQRINTVEQGSRSAVYASATSWSRQARVLAQVYSSVVRGESLSALQGSSRVS